MLYLAENLKKYRIQRNMTQEDIATFLGITAQSVSKWERGECYPDITLLPTLANIFETSVDLLLGMDAIRSAESRLEIHRNANQLQQQGDYTAAEKVYRDALLTYPNKPGMILGLAGTLALKGEYQEAIELIECGLPVSQNQRQKATMRAILCFLYLACNNGAKAEKLASDLPRIRGSAADSKGAERRRNRREY